MTSIAVVVEDPDETLRPLLCIEPAEQIECLSLGGRGDNWKVPVLRGKSDLADPHATGQPDKLEIVDRHAVRNERRRHEKLEACS